MALARDVISRVQRLMGDPHGDYNEEDPMLENLNMALHDISTRSLSVDEFSFLPVAQDIFRYGLMDDFLQARVVGFYNDYNRSAVDAATITRDWYPLGKRSMAFVTAMAENYRGGYLPRFYTIGGRSTLDKVTGSVVAHDETDLLFQSSDSVFSVKPGDRLINMTDGSETFVESATTNGNWIGYTALSGGEDNEMIVDDLFRVVSPQASRFTISIAPAPSYDDDMGYESLTVYHSRLHRKINQEHLDNENDELELDPEFDLALIHQTAYYASMSRDGIMDQTTLFHSAKYEAEYLENIPSVRKRVRESVSSWRSLAGAYSRRSEILNAPGVGNNPFTTRRLA